jgi:hypothetical protein
MIEVTGSSRRSFVFPATLPIAYAYYADVGRLLSYLPHICLVRIHGPDQFRVRYSSTEVGVYHICIYADVQATLENRRTVRIDPLNHLSPVQAQAHAHFSVAQGHFSSRSVFQAQGDRTRIEYSLQLGAHLPTPLALRFAPGTVLNRIARGITQMRIHEIAEGFIERSVDAFPCWLAELQDRGSLTEPGCTWPPTLPLPTCPEDFP